MNRRGRVWPRLCALCCAAGLAFPAASTESPPLVIGSKRFTESYILAAALAQEAKKAGPVKERPGLGNTAIVLAALKAGSIDLYPEYLGTIELEILKEPRPAGSLDAVNRELAGMGLAAGIPFGFDNTYALAVTQATAQRYRLHVLSDLKSHPELRIGLSQEFLGRRDGWPGLAQRYQLPQQPSGLDHGLAYEALASGQIDVTDVYSTDAKIAKYGLVVLADDRHYFPDYQALVLYRADVPTRFPAQWRALQTLTGRIDNARMIALNAAVELSGDTFDEAARQLTAPGPRGDATPAREEARPNWLAETFGGDFRERLFEHVSLVVTAVLAGSVVGIPLGLVAAFTRWRTSVMVTVGLLQTVPALALLAFLIPVVGHIGTVPTLIALFVYSLLPIVRNTAAGVAEVRPGLVEAAHALGLSFGQTLWLVQLPLARRVILAGIKTAAVITVGTATIAAFVGAGGFGQRITVGLALNDNRLLLEGALPAALLAIAFELAFSLVDAFWDRRGGGERV